MSLNMTRIVHDIGAVRITNAIADKLRERDVNVNFVTLSKEAHQFLARKSKECVYMMNRLRKYRIEGNPVDYLAKMEEKYDIPSIETIVTADLEHSKMPREKTYAVMAKHFRFWEDYLQKNEIDVILGGSERFINVIPRVVSKKYSVQYVTLNSSPIPGRSCVSTDVHGHHSPLDEYWKKNKNRELTKEEKERAIQFIKSFRQERGREFVWGSMPEVSLKKIKFFLDRTWKKIFVEGIDYPYMDISGGTWRYVLKLTRARLARKYYSEYNPKENYVFYPLHMPHEAQLRLRAQQYIDQVYVAENIARSLPAGYKLYVKEHPNHRGEFSLGELKKIAELPNVKLLPPPISSPEVAENSSCVVTINSTVGWEAMLLKKPVINLGRAFYEVSGLTYRLRDLYKLPETIREAIRENPVEERILIRFVNALFATSFPGTRAGAGLAYIYYGTGSQTQKILQEENIENLAEGIYNQLGDILGES